MKWMKACLAATLLSAAAAQAAPISFEVFIRLHKGMPEAELVAKAGAPDYSGDGGKTLSGSGAVTVTTTRQLTWLANDQLPYTTTVTVQNGVVTDIKRSKKL